MMFRHTNADGCPGAPGHETHIPRPHGVNREDLHTLPQMGGLLTRMAEIVQEAQDEFSDEQLNEMTHLVRQLEERVLWERVKAS